MSHTLVGARNPHMARFQNHGNQFARSAFPDRADPADYLAQTPVFPPYTPQFRADDVAKTVFTPVYPPARPQVPPTPVYMPRSAGQARRVAKTPTKGFCYFLYRLFRCLFCCH